MWNISEPIFHPVASSVVLAIRVKMTVLRQPEQDSWMLPQDLYHKY